VTEQERRHLTPRDFSSGPDDPFFNSSAAFPFPTPAETPMHGEGSGIIVSPDGIVITDAHP
jgi:hypothetical protein